MNIGLLIFGLHFKLVDVLIWTFVDLNDMVMSNVIDVVVYVIIDDGDIVACSLCTLLVVLPIVERYRKVR